MRGQPDPATSYSNQGVQNIDDKGQMADGVQVWNLDQGEDVQF